MSMAITGVTDKAKAGYYNLGAFWRGSAMGAGDIGRCLRFRSSATAYLSRTFSSTPLTYTLSLWAKRGQLGSVQVLAGCRLNAVATCDLVFDASDQLRLELYNSYVLTTTGKYFRDPSSWLHIVLSVTTNSTINLYVNGNLVGTGTATANSFLFNSAYTNVIGKLGDLSAQYLDGYISRVAFIDGQALAPTSFGYFNTNLNEWVTRTQAQVKSIVNAGGASSFLLDFDDGTTLTTLGYDKSSKANHWTCNNISLTAGPTYDHTLEAPGNSYATLNPLAYNTACTVPTISNANLKFLGPSGAVASVGASTMSVSSGKWYWEVSGPGGVTGTYCGITAMPVYTGAVQDLGARANDYAYRLDTGQKRTSGTLSAFATAASSTDIVGFALDLDAKTLDVYKNGTLLGTLASSIPAGDYSPAFDTYASQYLEVNFGQAPLLASATYHSSARGYFRHAPPTGFRALCQANLPDPIIKNPKNHFDVLTHSGDGTARDLTGALFTPDLVWGKSRNTAATSHRLVDSMRGKGTNYYKTISSNTTTIEAEDDAITSLISGGIRVAASANFPNTSGQTFVSWLWNAKSNFAELQRYTTPGTYTYTVPTGVTSLSVLVIGGGGGGGGSGAGCGSGGVGGNSTLDTLTANGGGAGGAGPNVSGAGGTGGGGSGGDGGISGTVGTAGDGTSLTTGAGLSSFAGFGNGSPITGWGGAGGGAGLRYATIAVSSGQQLSITVGAGGTAGAAGAGGAGKPGASGAVIIYNSTSGYPVNTQGTIVSTLTANQTAGISIVSYLGNATSGATVGHGLDVAPKMILVKNRDYSGSWVVYHKSLTSAAYYLLLNSTAVQTNTSNMWNSVAPSSSVFTLGNDGFTNRSGNFHIAYCFAEIEGFSKIGSYAGNASADGPFIWCGFKPQWIMIKSLSGGAENWEIFDATRTPINPSSTSLKANLDNSETTLSSFDVLSNGFKIRDSATRINGSGYTYVFIAFADVPGKYSLAK
ncbi:SPRY domain-containing protein [Bdellovibrio sp.]|uniref:DUF7483 domain-containing protein n=1 Tax=Bdellovibrio sp. TaxID=28201 RepID=UPI0039E38252